ncbi:hypothetical protein DFH29DRAFT_877865 [Suillus ampliporus]|nr:hypothetical protein DFH29DRAFT_877865 [Suillus ampliporus]
MSNHGPHKSINELHPRLSKQLNLVEELSSRVRELEMLVIQSQNCENEAHKLVIEAHCAPVVPLESRSRSAPVNPTNSRYQHASSVLPQTSSVKRAMMGMGPVGHDLDPSDPSSDSSSDDEQSSTESASSKSSSETEHASSRNGQSR